MRRWVIIAAAVIVVVVIGAVAVVTLTGGEDNPEGQAGSNLPPISSISSVVADAVVLPRKSAELSMPLSGIVSEVLVEEGQNVTAGDVLLRLVNDDESEAVAKNQADLAKSEARLAILKARQAKTQEDEDEIRSVDIARARLAVRDAEEELAHVSGANLVQGASVTPEGATKEAARLRDIAEARDALRKAQDAYLKALGEESTGSVSSSPASISNAALRKMQLADARLAVLNTQEEVDDVRDFQKRFMDAQDDLLLIQNEFDNATRDLQVAMLAEVEDTRNSQESLDEAEDDWRDIFDRFLGIELTEDELNQDPQTLFETWGLDLQQLFNRNSVLFPEGRIRDNPDTRWNELRIFAWISLHPQNKAVDVVCEDRVDEKLRFCLQQDFDDAWEAFDNAKIAFTTVGNDTATAIKETENRITRAEREREDAQEALDDLATERPDLDVAVAEAKLADVLAVLNDLEDFPDPVEVGKSQAEMASARAALDDLLDWPDPLNITLAREELAKKELELTKLENGRNPIDVAREQAELKETEADVASLQATLALAQIALKDAELRAPFSGKVVSTEVEVGEEVDTDTVVVRLADVSEWLIETDDLDELSVVNLSEGDTVTVTFDALPDIEVVGSVVNINQFGEMKQGAITYTAEIRLDQQDPRLRWNMTAAIKKEDTTSASLSTN